jgi:hypothetical protein
MEKKPRFYVPQYLRDFEGFLVRDLKKWNLERIQRHGLLCPQNPSKVWILELKPEITQGCI